MEQDGKRETVMERKMEDIYENMEEKSSKCQDLQYFFLMLFLFCGNKYQYLGERDVSAELVRA